MATIRSPRNSRVVAAVRLHRGRARHRTGLSLIEGPNLLMEAIAGGARLTVVFALEDDEPTAQRAHAIGLELVRVTQRVLDRIAATEHPRGPVAILEIPPPSSPAGIDLLVPWGVSDPGNLGALIRTAAAFGMGIGVGPGSADPWAPKVLRAAAGGHFHCPVSPLPDVDRLRSGGYRLVATVPRGGIPPQEADFGAQTALLVGEEAAGLPPDLIARADVRVTIPMRGGMESLNAAVAGAILAYELSRSRRGED